MIKDDLRCATIRKVVAASVEYSNLLSIKTEMENCIISGIDSMFTSEEITVARNNRDKIKFQKDIDLEYALNVAYGYRHYMRSACVLSIGKSDKPEIITSYHDITDENSSLKEENSELYNQLNSLLKKFNKEVKDLEKKIKAVDDVLSMKSMNITSIKKYYPELYELIKK